jgi:hypothetical protein
MRRMELLVERARCSLDRRAADSRSAERPRSKTSFETTLDASALESSTRTHAEINDWPRWAVLDCLCQPALSATQRCQMPVPSRVVRRHRLQRTATPAHRPRAFGHQNAPPPGQRLLRTRRAHHLAPPSQAMALTQSGGPTPARRRGTKSGRRYLFQETFTLIGIQIGYRIPLQNRPVLSQKYSPE